MFDAKLAQTYMEHRTLTSYPTKIWYMTETNFDGTVEDFHKHMVITAREFNAMIYEMIAEANKEE